MARITIHPTATIGTVQPALHGHFSEHLGRCVYDGLWTAADTAEQGYRDDVLELFADIEPPVLRWPGGCFADDYHWEDGIGPRATRPRRRNLFWAQGRAQRWEESNTFGTDEFLTLCERLETEPYLAVNVGSGTPRQAADWVEYCCADGDTELADRRRANGRELPYDVPFWGIGNENWGCGGQMTPEQYARAFRRYATYVGAMDRHVASNLELIACGFQRNEWNRRFLEEVRSGAWGTEFPLDHLTFHHYYGGTVTVTDADLDSYDQFLVDARAIEELIDATAAAIDAVATTRDIGVIVDEWGAWHPEATADNGLEQPGSVLDALSAAAVLDVCNHHADVLTMTNIAQTVNVLHCLVETDGEDAWPRPTYYVYDLYRKHRENLAVRTDVDAPTRQVADDVLPLVAGSASVDGDHIFLTLTNLDCRSAHDVAIELPGAHVTAVDVQLLFADHDPAADTTPETATAFGPAPLSVTDDSLACTLPPATVAGVDITHA